MIRVEQNRRSNAAAKLLPYTNKVSGLDGNRLNNERPREAALVVTEDLEGGSVEQNTT